MTAAGAIKTQQKGPLVLLAMTGLILTIVISSILFAMVIAPHGFCPVPETAIRQIQALNEPTRISGRRAGNDRHGVEGAAERDATERPSVPGWDPVIRLPAADLADLDPDQVVNRALGEVSVNETLTPVPAPSAGRFTSTQSAPTATRTALAEADADKTAGLAKASDAEHAPAHQVLPPPPHVQPAAVFAIQMAFFLDPKVASDYAATLARDGVTTRLVEQLDEAGRRWVYVRSPVFTDSLSALAYAETLERKFGLSALLVREPPPQAPSGAPGK